MNPTINPQNIRLFLLLSIGFIIATVIGTLSHECGHYFVDRCLGFQARINYAESWIIHSPTDPPITQTDRILMVLGGPIETMGTGCIGLLLLFIRRKRFYATKWLSSGQWLIIFLSLFWLRQTTNFVMWTGNYLLTGDLSTRSDEVRLAKYFHIPIWSLSVVTAMIGAYVLYVITFKVIPAQQRLVFMLAGIVGGVLGYLIWLEWFGKVLMP